VQKPKGMTMKKLIIALSCCAMLVLLSLPAYAQTPPDNIQQLRDEIIQLKNSISNMETLIREMMTKPIYRSEFFTVVPQGRVRSILTNGGVLAIKIDRAEAYYSGTQLHCSLSNMMVVPLTNITVGYLHIAKDNIYNGTVAIARVDPAKKAAFEIIIPDIPPQKLDSILIRCSIGSYTFLDE
jgi:hypothetical protein